ncbi:MAG TPA: DALR anticodon-binding domain-containing protein [Nostocaceae cyanobacterium]|nr:DALR anticodon-binding domain-containing protein [Nostocaceae cyanobacterium]
MEPRKISLYKGVDHEKTLYISGVALQLAKFHNSPAIEIARGIADHLTATCDGLLSVQIVPPGWIHLELTAPALATWLHNLTLEGLGLEEIASRKITSVSSSVLLFSVQYSHARCYALLRLAEKKELIQLREQNIAPNAYSLFAAQPIPWLNDEGRLRFNQPDEMHLIDQLIQIIDDWVCDNHDSINWESSAGKLSQAFENFWCNCRIWGDVTLTTPELAQARLGLLIATQLVLRLLLEVKLGVVAPVEL